MRAEQDRRTRRRLAPALRRAELIAAAQQAFATAPYDAVSITDIAARAGASAALIHHHFGSKQDLYLAVLASSREELRERLDRAGPPGLPPGERLERGVLEYLRFVQERSVGWTALQRGEREARDPRVVALLERQRGELLAGLRAALPQPLSPAAELALHGYLGFVDAMCLAWINSPEPRADRADLASAARGALRGALVAVGQDLPTTG